MNPFQLIAENKIREAMENGEFDNLPGQGKPIDFSEDEHIPTEFRLAYRILKNSGHAVESEADLIQQIQALRAEANGQGLESKREAAAKMVQYKEAQLLARRYRSQSKKPSASSDEGSGNL